MSESYDIRIDNLERQIDVLKAYIEFLERRFEEYDCNLAALGGMLSGLKASNEISREELEKVFAVLKYNREKLFSVGILDDEVKND